MAFVGVHRDRLSAASLHNAIVTLPRSHPPPKRHHNHQVQTLGKPPRTRPRVQNLKQEGMCVTSKLLHKKDRCGARGCLTAWPPDEGTTDTLSTIRRTCLLSKCTETDPQPPSSTSALCAICGTPFEPALTLSAPKSCTQTFKTSRNWVQLGATGCTSCTQAFKD